MYVQNPLTKLWEPGMIVDVFEEPRSYLVQVAKSKLRRSTQFLKPRSNSEPVLCNFNSSLLSYLCSAPQISTVNNHINNIGNPVEPPSNVRRSSRLHKTPQKLTL